MAAPLHNYMRTYRRRYYLTQHEMGFLLGWEGRSQVSCYERLVREPSLRTAFGCQVIFSISSEKLFPALFRRAEDVTVERALLLRRALITKKQTPLLAKKAAFLSALVAEHGGTESA